MLKIFLQSFTFITQTASDFWEVHFYLYFSQIFPIDCHGN